MKHTQVSWLVAERVDRGCIVADQNHLGILQAQHPEGLGPAPVIADRHADVAANKVPHPKSQVPHFKVQFLEMLVTAFGIEVAVAGQVYLAILAHNRSIGADKNCGVKASFAPVLLDPFRITKIEGDPVLARCVEQGLGVRAGHFGFVVAVDFRLVLHVPAGKEGREGKLWENHQTAAPLLCANQQGNHSIHRHTPVVALLQGAELRGPHRH